MPEKSQAVLWAPWRLEYILGEKEQGCIFCTRISQNKDDDNLIVRRGAHSIVIMNRYPYNNGHLMVVPHRHVGDLTALPPPEANDVMYWLQRSIEALRLAMQPQGFNVGLNLGRIAGAGVDEHVHFHVVPRWDADTNFMPVIAGTHVVPEAIRQTHAKLKSAFDQLMEMAG